MKLKMVLLLLVGGLTASCNSYRIEIHQTETAEYYVASKKAIPPGYFFPIWMDHYHAFNTKDAAIDQINVWKTQERIDRENRNRKIIFIK
jgi:hypothetical protein